MGMTNRKLAPKPPYPDWDEEECRKGSFHNLVWYPTAGLRFVERQLEDRTARILQQQWETRIVNNVRSMENIINPHYTQWRDIPLVIE
jgi:hypothetical protein